MKSLILRPTRLGLYLIGLNFILFILSIGYSNNLLFFFTLVLLAQTIFWYVETLRFKHPRVKNIKVSSCFLGEETYCHFSGDNLQCTEVTFVINGEKKKAAVMSKLQDSLITTIRLQRRGKFHLDRISFYDSRPFSFFARKIDISPSLIFYVYPKLQQGAALVVGAMNSTQLEALESQRKGEDDFLGLDPYHRQGFKKIDWKYYARSGELYIKQGLSPELPALHFEVSHSPSEEDLSAIASQLVAAHRGLYSFSLKTKDQLISLDSGPGHLQRCLARLSEC